MEAAFHDLPEGVPERHLAGLDEGIAEHRDAPAAGRLSRCMVAVAEALAIDGDAGAGGPVAAFEAGARRPAEAGIEAVELGVREPGDPQAELEHGQRRQHAEAQGGDLLTGHGRRRERSNARLLG